MTDDELKEAVAKMMAEQPGITRSNLRKELKTSMIRLKRLGVPLPQRMSHSEGGRMGRRASGWHIHL